MQIDTKLQEPFSYSLIPILIVLVVLIIPFIYKVLKKYIKS